jgi:cobalt transporter subunit CbtB
MPGVATDIPDAPSHRVAVACAALLGLVLVYGAGLAPTEILHNGAHDARHAAGFPCH